MYNDNDNHNHLTGTNKTTTTNFPKFNSLNPLPFFFAFISFCQRAHCAQPLNTKSGSLDDITPLEETIYSIDANLRTPSRAELAVETPQPRRQKGGRSDPPKASDVTDQEYEQACRETRERRSKAEKFKDQCAKIAGFLREAVQDDALGGQIIDDVLGDTGIDGPKALLALWSKFGAKSQSTFINLEFQKFRQRQLDLNTFLSRLNHHFKLKKRCGNPINDREKCDAMITRINPELVSLAHSTCIQKNYQWIEVTRVLLEIVHVDRVRRIMEHDDETSNHASGAMRAAIDQQCRICKRKGHFAKDCIQDKSISRDEKARRFQAWVDQRKKEGTWKDIKPRTKASYARFANNGYAFSGSEGHDHDEQLNKAMGISNEEESCDESMTSEDEDITANRVQLPVNVRIDMNTNQTSHTTTKRRSKSETNAGRTTQEISESESLNDTPSVNFYDNNTTQKTAKKRTRRSVSKWLTYVMLFVISGSMTCLVLGAGSWAGMLPSLIMLGTDASPST